MKFELVEFYKWPFKQKNQKERYTLGTVHVYWIDQELDIRGILVKRAGKGMFFAIPHFNTLDEEGKPCRYPLIRFTNEEKQKEFLNFLHQVVKPKVKEILKSNAE
jgi:DNA-binding cell septation regulator SpoVG